MCCSESDQFLYVLHPPFRDSNGDWLETGDYRLVTPSWLFTKQWSLSRRPELDSVVIQTGISIQINVNWDIATIINYKLKGFTL